MKQKLFKGLKKSQELIELSKWSIFDNYDEVTNQNFFIISDEVRILKIKALNQVSFNKTYANERTVTTKCVFGIINTNIDIGSFKLRPESIVDKLLDPFLRNDLDLGISSLFDDKYHLEVSNKTGIRDLFSIDLINCILNSESMEMEGNKDMIILCLSRLPYDKRIIKNTIEVCKNINKVIN